MFIGLIQADFREGRLAKECAWKTVVLILKVNDDFHGIGLVELMWKTVTGILNFRLTAVIRFHNTLHGLCTGRGARTASPKAKLI